MFTIYTNTNADNVKTKRQAIKAAIALAKCGIKVLVTSNQPSLRKGFGFWLSYDFKPTKSGEIIVKAAHDGYVHADYLILKCGRWSVIHGWELTN